MDGLKLKNASEPSLIKTACKDYPAADLVHALSNLQRATSAADLVGHEVYEDVIYIQSTGRRRRETS